MVVYRLFENYFQSIQIHKNIVLIVLIYQILIYIFTNNKKKKLKSLKMNTKKNKAAMNAITEQIKVTNVGSRNISPGEFI